MRTFQLLYRGSILGAVLPVLFLKRAAGTARLLLVVLVALSAAACGVSCLLYRRLPADEKKDFHLSGSSLLSVHPYISFAVLAFWSAVLIVLFCFPALMDTAVSSVLFLLLILITVAACVVKYRAYRAKTRKQKPPIIHKKRRNKHR